MQFINLIIISKRLSNIRLKELIDIALVSSSYNIDTAIYFSESIILPHVNNPIDDLEQSFNMIEDFEIPIFCEKNIIAYQQDIKQFDLDKLKSVTKNILQF